MTGAAVRSTLAAMPAPIPEDRNKPPRPCPGCGGPRVWRLRKPGSRGKSLQPLHAACPACLKRRTAEWQAAHPDRQALIEARTRVRRLERTVANAQRRLDDARAEVARLEAAPKVKVGEG